MDDTDRLQGDTYQAHGLRRELAVIKGNVPRVEEGDKSLGPVTVFGALAVGVLGLFAYQLIKEKSREKKS